MNICILSRGHISKTRGGVDKVTTTLAEELTRRGYSIYFVSQWAPDKSEKLGERSYILPENKEYSEKNKEFLAELYKKNGIELIINQADSINLFNLIADSCGTIPIVSCIHSDPIYLIKGLQDCWDEWKLKKKWEFRILFPFYLAKILYIYHSRKKFLRNKYIELYSRSDAVILLSELFKKNFIRYSGIKDTSKLYAVPNPNTYLGYTGNTQAKEDLIIFVGRLDFQKRVDRLLKIWESASREHKSWKLKIIGDGDHADFYKTYAKKLNLRNIEFVGHADPTEYYKKAKILCMTSTHEGFGMVITEALQFNVIPMLYNSYESCNDIIEDNKNGILITPFSIYEYVSRLIGLMEEPESIERIQDGIKRFNNEDKFNRIPIANEWEKIIKRVTRKGRTLV